MATFQTIAGWILVVLVLFLMRKPIFRFLRNAAHNAYDRAVTLAGGIILIIIVAVLVFFLNGK